jgi:hypothetical protein
MLFWRYSLEDEVINLKPRVFSHLIKFNPGRLDSLCGIFLARDKFADTYKAHDYSAITYYPRSGGSFDIDFDKFKVLTNENRILDGNSNVKVIGRSWPAFGSLGGTREIILIDDEKRGSIDSLKRTQLINFKDGGEIDYYRGDNTESYGTMIAEAISTGVLDIELPEKPNVEGMSGFYKPGMGTAVFYRLGHRLYSISVGTKFFGKTGKIHFWAYTYEDDDHNLERKYFGPIEDTIQFTCLQRGPCEARTKIVDNMKVKYYPYKDISDLSGQMLTQLLSISDGYFNQNAKKWALK